MGRFFINCDEATAICNKSQYNEATFIEKFKLSFHLFICKKCGMYSKQNTTVTKVCDKHLNKPQCDCKLTEQEKETLQQKINEQLK
jgi:hypothetical protein